jgi:hypothetical protein
VTIAACYLSPEGIVLGADSTSTYNTPAGPHYFNHGQKIFEIGESSTLGIVTWGLGGLAVSSHRMLIASLADEIRRKKPKTVGDAATTWAGQFWSAYSASLAADIQVCRVLHQKPPFDPLAVPPIAGARTKDEENKFRNLRGTMQVGFCLAGYLPPDRTPSAFQLVFDPIDGKPIPSEIPMGSQRFWGAPNMIARLLNGSDETLRKSILDSGKWSGTDAELDTILKKQGLAHPPAPMRDAVDFTYACILSTIKALKFSEFAQTCGPQHRR